MGPLPTLSIKNQTLTVLENRLQEPGNQVLIKDKTTSNCKQLLLPSGATPIGSAVAHPIEPTVPSVGGTQSQLSAAKDSNITLSSKRTRRQLLMVKTKFSVS